MFRIMLFRMYVYSIYYGGETSTVDIHSFDKFLLQEVLAIIVFKAMGFVSDQQIVQMVGTEPLILSRLAYSLFECANLNIFSQNQALE